MSPETDPHKYSGPLEDLEKEKSGASMRIPILIGVLILVLAVGVAAFFITEEEGSGSVDTSLVVIPFIAIWSVFIIPIINKHKQKKGQATSAPLNPEQKRIVVFVILGVALLIAFAMGIFVFLAAG